MQVLSVQMDRFPEVAVTFIILLVFVYHHMMKSHDSHGLQPKVNCTEGHYLYHHDTTISYCIPCPPRTFIPDALHSRTECLRCTEPSTRRHERVVKTCSLRSDTILGCQAGYYMVAGPGRTKCAKCSVCKRGYHVGSTCEGTRNTVCCPAPGMTVVVSESGAEECVFVRVENFRQNSAASGSESRKLSEQQVTKKMRRARLNLKLKQWYMRISNIELIEDIHTT